MRWWCSALVLLVACGPRVAVDTGEDDGSSGEDASSGEDDDDSDGDADASDGGDADDGGDDAPSVTDVPTPGVCLQTPEFMCPNGVGDCENLACGNIISPFDGNGCLRPRCPCPDGLTCFSPVDLGGCAPSEIRCAENGDGGCDCTSSDDCGGTYCVPADAIPYPCLWATNREECMEANCMWAPGSRVVVGDLECSCDEVQGVCVPPVGIEPEFTTYSFDALPSEAIALPLRLSGVPPGLTPCEELGPSVACECAASLMCG